MSNFKKLRIFILLLIMLGIGADAWLTRVRTTSWNRTLWVYVYPIAGDNSPVTAKYLDHLARSDYQPVEQFMSREARRYGVAESRPVYVARGRTLNEQPPPPPYGGNVLQIMHWSLKLRWWARGAERDQPGPPGNMRIFVIYQDPAVQKQLPHSLGLQKGQIGVVHAFASKVQNETNNVVLVHELLHTVGATDKYELANGRPQFPDGYADPQLTPRYPQSRAEIMGGRVPLSESEAEMPHSLDHVVVGPLTAREIGWVK